MQLGYARVSTPEQSFDTQVDALEEAGCEQVFKETASGAKTDRTEFTNLMRTIRQGDTLVVYKFDRVARSLRQLIEVLEEAERVGFGFKSLTEKIDTTTPGGRLVFGMMGALSEFERDLIRERTQAGIKAARERGRVGGRPRKMTSEKMKAAKKLLDAGTPIGEVSGLLSVSPATLYRWCPASAR